jgi:hypothetical protein
VVDLMRRLMTAPSAMFVLFLSEHSRDNRVSRRALQCHHRRRAQPAYRPGHTQARYRGGTGPGQRGIWTDRRLPAVRL